MKKYLFLGLCGVGVVFLSYGSSAEKIEHVPLHLFKVEDVFLEEGGWRAETLTWMFVVLGNSKKGLESLDTLFLKRFMGKKPKGIVLKEGAFTSCTVVPPIKDKMLNQFSLFICNAQIKGRKVTFAFRAQDFFDLDAWCVCDKNKRTLGAPEAVDYLEIFED